MKNKFLLLIATVLFAVSPLLANGPIIEKAETNATEQSHCGVYDDQIKMYMLGYGHIITEISAVEGQCDVIAYSIDERRFIVHISEGAIIGYDDAY
jgi:hypothetical protein